jgi:AcrR family transcriptional regulator
MARRRPPDRFQQLWDAALHVFGRKGLRRARMADIAREMGVSPGTLYNYVESKEALFGWLIDRGGEEGAIAAPARLPLPTPLPGQLEKRLQERLDAGFRLASLDAALARRRVVNARAELDGILREFWELVVRTRGSIAVVERSALDLPDLFAIWFVGARRAFFARVARYVERRARSGHFRPVADPAVAARFLLEGVVFFARHRHGDPDPSLLPEDAGVRDTVIPMLVASICPTPEPERRP